MSRILSTMVLDTVVQWRNRFYFIGVGMGLLVAFILATFFDRDFIAQAMPTFFLITVGGTTLLYIAGLVIFEKDEGTIDALIVSPLRHSEYLISKLVTLGMVATVEAVLIVLFSYGFNNMNPVMLIAGVWLLAIQLTLVGMILIVRFETITDFLTPMLVIGVVVQLPIFYYVSLFDTPLLLAVPTGAPAMLIRGAWVQLQTWELAYAFGYSVVSIVLGFRWALSAFDKFIVRKERG